MDTKWKKFKRSYFTKTLCFLLAMLVMILGASRAFDFAKEVEKNDTLYGLDYYDNILSQGNEFDLEASPLRRLIKDSFRQLTVMP